MRKSILITLSLLILFALTPETASAFAERYGDYGANPPGFFTGILHGLLAPYSLIARYFGDFVMYVTPNAGIAYDAGFLIGVAGAFPIGWLIAILATVNIIFL